MLLEQLFTSFSLIHLVNSHLQINLYLTDWVTEDDHFQHHCLQVPAHMTKESDPRQIISYCMTELPSKFPIKENNHDQKFTFEQLAKQKITNQQLYLWSAPIDLIEHYQSYLNQLAKSPKSSLTTEIFYNCTLPSFGPQCQYVLQDHHPYHLSLDEIVHDYYRYNRYKPTLLTCYMHLECNRGPSPSCLDWTEICDGKVDCLDDGYDEEHCWQLESHPDEHPHSNNDCISEIFFRDDSNIPNCVDSFTAMAINDLISNEKDASVAEPTFKQEDISCTKHNNIGLDNYILTSSCVEDRTFILFQAMFSIKPNSINDECWTTLNCIIRLFIETNPIDIELCDYTVIHEIINKMCPNIVSIPAVPVLFGHIYLAYEKTTLMHPHPMSRSAPKYFCYNNQRLHVIDDDNEELLIDNHTCRFHIFRRAPTMNDGRWFRRYISPLYNWLRMNTVSIDKNSEPLDKSIMYKCVNRSQYISKTRLLDGVIDCYHLDDESILNTTCSQERNDNYYRCATIDQCIPTYSIQNGICDCEDDDYQFCDDEDADLSHSLTSISFQTICDGYTNLSPRFIREQNETDETNCDHWPLIHVYNRCDGFWHQLDGSDEVNCDPSPLLNCSTNDHICVSPTTNQLMCLPIRKANDGIIDCLGAADEPTLCRDHLDKDYPLTFYCYKNGFTSCTVAQGICDTVHDCPNNEEEQACRDYDLFGVLFLNGICKGHYESNGSDVAKVLCRRFSYTFPKLRVHFTLDQWPNLIKRHQKSETTLSHQSTKQNIQYYQQPCHRGLNLQVWLDKTKNITRNVCLCPPSYYGNTCQYQNQRVSLTLQFYVTPDSVEIPLIIIVSLIDDSDERIIHSAEQFTYLSLKHCQKKFDLYLLYSTRPKNTAKDYFIQIDVYEKTTLEYRVSLMRSLNYSFLPVHRLALRIDIPRIVDDCSDVQCLNGECRRYFNHRYNQTFCQCHEGWFGRFCSFSYISTCSSSSLSLGKLANNRSLCVCPMNRIGPRCLIDDTICENITCSNHGQCVSIDQYQSLEKKFVCICSQGFTGDQCQINNTKLIITFDKNITLSSSIFIHFIEVKLDASPIRTTTPKVISFGQQSMTVYWSLPFHMVFVELFNRTYYLTHLQTIYKQSSIIEQTLNTSHRCLHINELFNQTIANSSLLHRIKYYHQPCQTHLSQLKCFYDELHLCLCQKIDQQYVANCFQFDHNMSFYCSSQSGCENGGQCFQEQTSCPKVSVCQCPTCYYGARCQLTTNGFTLSLDAILGYHIRPNLAISRQPWAVLISLILTLIITLLGLANGLFSFITFQQKTTRESGCGLYLFTSSLITLLTMIVFLLKFLILLLSQMGSITNRSFLLVQCHLIDFLLRFSLTMDQWLTASVAIERAFILFKGVHFDKNKSKLTAKWTISGLVLMIIVTNIHDPIFHSLFEENGNDDDEKRLWCIVKYPPTIRIINLTINILHFILPFIINCIAALVIIFINARQQAAIKKKKKKYREILNEQVQQHRNLLIGPCVLIILAIPRLIMSFTSNCMKSASDSWLFLVGYFISLIPPLLTFILFVLPSTTYKQAFRKAVSRYRNLIMRRS